MHYLAAVLCGIAGPAVLAVHADEPVKTEKRTPPAVIPEKPAVTSVTYLSPNGGRMTAVFGKSNNSVTVTLPDKNKVTLTQAISGSGIRYTNGSSVFWEHQGEGRYFVDEKVIFEGKAERGK